MWNGVMVEMCVMGGCSGWCRGGGLLWGLEIMKSCFGESRVGSGRVKGVLGSLFR